MEIVTLIISVIAGLILCLFGFKWSKVVISFAGFYLGLILSKALLSMVLNMAILEWVIAFIIGILVGCVSYKLYRFGVFLVCGLVAGSFAFYLVPFAVWNIILAIGVAILGGYLGLVFQKYAVIISTSFFGGFHIVDAATKYFNFQEKKFIILISCVLSILGVIYQIYSNRENPHKDK